MEIVNLDLRQQRKASNRTLDLQITSPLRKKIFFRNTANYFIANYQCFSGCL